MIISYVHWSDEKLIQCQNLVLLYPVVVAVGAGAEGVAVIVGGGGEAENDEEALILLFFYLP